MSTLNAFLIALVYGLCCALGVWVGTTLFGTPAWTHGHSLFLVIYSGWLVAASSFVSLGPKRGRGG